MNALFIWREKKSHSVQKLLFMFAVQEIASLFSDYFAILCKGMNAQK